VDRTTEIRFEEVEDGFRNLQQTVPPENESWWNDHYGDWPEELERLKAEAADGKPVHRELDVMEERLMQAKEELGSRTAAGRAKNL
jgi:hypothetical protein